MPGKSIWRFLKLPFILSVDLDEANLDIYLGTISNCLIVPLKALNFLFFTNLYFLFLYVLGMLNISPVFFFLPLILPFVLIEYPLIFFLIYWELNFLFIEYEHVKMYSIEWNFVMLAENNFPVCLLIRLKSELS